ncbi:hypothetical protein ACFQXA_20975 [Nocardiopsis composta]
MSSAVAAPLRARGELLGVLTLALSRLTPATRPPTTASTATWSARSPAGSRWPSTTPGCSRRSAAPRWPSRTACCPTPSRPSTGCPSRTATCPPGRWRPRGAACRPRSAATSTTSSRCPPGGSASSSATWRAADRTPPR